MARFNRSFSDGGQKISGTDAEISGDAVITGDLTVNGTTTTISSTTLTVADKVIVVAQGAADSAAADGAGLSVDGADASLLYDDTGTQWEFNKPLEVTGAISSTSTITVGTDLTVTGGDIAFGATNSTVTVGASAHDAAGANLTISSGSTTAGTSNNQAGGSLTISGGQGKGSGAGGDIIFKTANAGSSGSSLNSLATALTISDDKSATFEDNITVKGDLILDDGGSIKEAGGTAAITIDASGNVTKIGQDSPSTGEFLKYDGAKWVSDAVATGSSAADDISTGDAAVTIATTSGNITLDAQAGDADIIFKGTDDSSDITALTLDMSEAGAALFNAAVTVGTDLTVTGGDISYSNGQDSTLSVATTGAGVDGRDLTISAGSAPTGSANQNGGDLLLKSGGGDGTGTSMIAFHTKVNGTDAAAERMRIHTDGNVGIGTNAPVQILQVSDATPIVVIQNTTNEHTDGGAESKVLFADHAGNALSQVEGAHSGSSDDAKGQLKLSTSDGSSTQLALTLDENQDAIFSSHVDIAASHAYKVNGTAILSDSSGTMTLSNVDALDATTEATIESAIDTLSNLTTTGALNSGSITSGFGNIDIGSSTFDTTGAVGTGGLTVGGDLAVNGDTATFTSSNANDPQIILKNTTNDAAGPTLLLENDRGSNNGADNDVCGIIDFKGTDDNSDQVSFAKIQCEVADASNGAEGGRLLLGVATHDAEMQFGLVLEDGDAEDEIDAVIGNGDNSVTTAAGYMKANNGFLVPEQKSVHIETPMLATADHTATGITTILTASESIAQGDLVYISGNGTIGKADADAVAKMPAIGLAVAAISSSAQGVILLQGMFRDDTFNFTAGDRLFASTTDGGITATVPSGSSDVAQAVGVALSDDVIYFKPDMTLVEIS